MDIKYIENIEYDVAISQDHVSVDWFDLQKKHLTLTTDGGVTIIFKQVPKHWHKNPILVCEDNYRIVMTIRPSPLVKLMFNDALLFAKTAYAVGNLHQPIHLLPSTITVLDDAALTDVIRQAENDPDISVTRFKGIFKPNGHSSHSH